MLKIQIQGKTLDIPFEPTFQNMVFVFFLSLLSGYYSKMFLHILEKFFKNYGKIAEEAKKEAEEATAQAKLTYQYSMAISFADTILKINQPINIVKDTILRLNDLSRTFQTDRLLFIHLGRLYRALGDRFKSKDKDKEDAIQCYKNAIDVLDRYIRNIKKEGKKTSESEINICDAWYNIACYKNLIRRITDDEQLKEKLKSEIVDILTKEAHNRDYKDNIEYLETDEDFDDPDPNPLNQDQEKKNSEIRDAVDKILKHQSS